MILGYLNVNSDGNVAAVFYVAGSLMHGMRPRKRSKKEACAFVQPAMRLASASPATTTSVRVTLRM